MFLCRPGQPLFRSILMIIDQVLAYFSKNPRASITEAANDLEIKRKSVANAIDVLMLREKLTDVGGSIKRLVVAG